jgi:hypothetical protein
MAVGSVNVSSWINEKNALTAYKGLHLNRSWEAWIISNNRVDQKPISNRSTARTTAYFVGYSLFTTFNHVEYILSPARVAPYGSGYFPDPRGPYFYAALLLYVLNAAKFIKEYKSNLPSLLEADSQLSKAPVNNSPIPTGMDKFLVVVSKATPYLMIITNIAITIIQIRRGDTSAWITLAFTGITLIDITSWKPKEYRWYLNTVLGYPVAAAAIYYANNLFRIKIIFNLVLSNQTLMEMIAEPFKENLSELGNWLEQKRKELEKRVLELQNNQSLSQD